VKREPDPVAGRAPSADDLARLARSAAPPGLCATCRHASVLASRSSVFLRCGRADFDPTFPKYPRLPVLACRGYERVEEGGSPA
jgi:hypothetical protein